MQSIPHRLPAWQGAVIALALLAGIAASVSGLSVVGTAHAASTPNTQPKPGTIIHQPNCHQPPAHTSIATLAVMPESELAYYGLPSHLAVPDAKKWAYLVSHIKQRSCTGIVTSQTFAPHNEHGPTISNNWAGYSSNSAEGWKVSEVSWTVPQITNCAYYSSAVAQWSGIGGVNGSIRLIQSGTSEFSNLCTSTKYYAWVENLGNQSGQPGYDSNYPSTAIEVFTPNIGDNMFSYTHQYPGNVEMYIEDVTKGINADYFFGPTPQPSWYECIHERSQGFGVLPTQNVGFVACEGMDNTGAWSYISNNVHAYYQLEIQMSSVLDAYPSTPPTSDGRFTVYPINYN